MFFLLGPEIQMEGWEAGFGAALCPSRPWCLDGLHAAPRSREVPAKPEGVGVFVAGCGGFRQRASLLEEAGVQNTTGP